MSRVEDILAAKLSGKPYDKKPLSRVEELLLNLGTDEVAEPKPEPEPIVEEEPIIEEPVIEEEPAIEEEPKIEEAPGLEELLIEEGPVIEEPEEEIKPFEGILFKPSKSKRKKKSERED